MTGSKNVLRVLAGIAAVAALLVGPAAGLARAADTVETMNVNGVIADDGSLKVTETFNFASTPPASITQRLANYLTTLDNRQYRYTISDIGVVSSTATVAASTSSDDYTVLTVTTNGTVEPIGITYTVKGAALKDSDTGTTIRWRLLQGLSLQVNTFDAVVTAPGIAEFVTCEAGPPASPGACGFYAASTHENPDPVFHDTGLGAGEMVGIALRYSSKTVTPNEDLRELWTLGRAFSVTPAILGVAAALGLLGGLLFWFLHRRYGTDALAATEPARIAEFAPVGKGESEFTVLEGVRPGQVGTVLDERVDPVDVTATLLDLATRGHLVIRELPLTNPHAARDWAFERGAGTDELLPYEKTLLDAVAPAKGAKVTVSSLASSVGPVIGEVQSQLYDDVVEKGWFVRRPDQARSSWALYGWIALGAAVLITLLLVAFTKYALIGVVLIGLALALVFVAQQMPARSAAGASMLNGLAALRSTLATQPTDQLPKGQELGQLSKLLPYAVVLGGVDRWLKAIADADADATPDGDDLSWYKAGPDWNLSDLPASLHNFLTTVQGTLFRRG